MRVLLVALVLLAPVLAGCVTNPAGFAANTSADLSPVEFPSIKKEEKLLPMADGVQLDNWVYRPDAPGQFPVVIESRPYFGNADPPAKDEGQKFSKWLIHELVPRGYVVVLHSIRGTGDSQGCYGQGGITEQKDEAATVEAFAKESYSTGKVAMIGKSYGGTTPWEAAVQAPPHLVTIVPIEGITDWYKYLFTNGVTIASQAGFDASYPQDISYDVPPGTAQPNFANYPGKACQDTVEMQTAEEQSHATGDKTAFWQERDYEAKVDAINKANISVYLVHGFQDWNVKPDHVATIYNKLTVEKRLVVGQQDHQYPLRADWGADLTRWFDHTLKGKDNGIDKTPPVMLLDSAGVWHTEDSFPPLRATNATVALTFDQATYVSSPSSETNDPTPGPDKAIWKGNVTIADVHVSGIPTLAFNATIVGGNAQFVATLYDVNGSTWKPVNWAAMDARHAGGLESSQNNAPGSTVPIRVALYPMDHDLAPGHAWGLVLAGAGAYWKTGPVGMTAATAQVAIVGATLTFPVLDRLNVESPQPAMKKADELGWTS